MGGKGGTGAVRGGGGGGGGTKNPTERLDWPTARGNSSVGRAQPCQGWGRGFESRFPLARSDRATRRAIGPRHAPVDRGHAKPKTRDGDGVVVQSDSKLDRKSTRLNSSHTVISYAV